MVDQFVCSWKVPSCGVIWQLGTLIIGPTPGQLRWYKSPGPGLKIGAKPLGLPGGIFWKFSFRFNFILFSLISYSWDLSTSDLRPVVINNYSTRKPTWINLFYDICRAVVSFLFLIERVPNHRKTGPLVNRVNSMTEVMILTILIFNSRWLSQRGRDFSFATHCSFQKKQLVFRISRDRRKSLFFLSARLFFCLSNRSWVSEKYGTNTAQFKPIFISIFRWIATEYKENLNFDNSLIHITDYEHPYFPQHSRPTSINNHKHWSSIFSMVWEISQVINTMTNLSKELHIHVFFSVLVLTCLSSQTFSQVF